MILFYSSFSFFRSFFLHSHTGIFPPFSCLCFHFFTFLPHILFPIDVHSSVVILQNEWDGTILSTDPSQVMSVTEGILKPSEVARIWFTNLGLGLYFTFNVYSWKYNTNFILSFWLSFFLPASRVSSSWHTGWLKQTYPRIIYILVSSKAAPALYIIPCPSIISTVDAGKESPASNPLTLPTSTVLGAGSPWHFYSRRCVALAGSVRALALVFLLEISGYKKRVKAICLHHTVS